MLDPFMRTLIDKPLNIVGKRVAAFGITANATTIAGFIFGGCAMFLIAKTYYLTAALFFALNRICDGLDGAIARQTYLSDFGGFLDIVCDMIIYAGIVFAFGLSDSTRWFFAAFLIFSFVGPMIAFLAYAVVAEKRKHTTQKRGKKSFYYLGGLCEGTETAVTLLSMCLFPGYFNIICIVYGVLCWFTTLERIYKAWHEFV